METQTGSYSVIVEWRVKRELTESWVKSASIREYDMQWPENLRELSAFKELKKASDSLYKE